VRDGEGATKFVQIDVTGAESDAAATAIAFSVGNSPIVKTALAAEDPNWGRIVMAVGKAGERADRDQLGSYSEERAAEHLRRSDVLLSVDVGIASGAATIWTCDLTHGYIEINAGYRT